MHVIMENQMEKEMEKTCKLLYIGFYGAYPKVGHQNVVLLILGTPS